MGGLDKHGKLSVKYRVSSIKDISILINHLDKYPLKTQKRADYLLFKRAPLPSIPPFPTGLSTDFVSLSTYFVRGEGGAVKKWNGMKWNEMGGEDERRGASRL